MLNEKWSLSRVVKCKEILFRNFNHVVGMFFILSSILSFAHYSLQLVFFGILRSKTTTAKMNRYFASKTIYSNGAIVFHFFKTLFIGDDNWCMALHHNMCIRTIIKYYQDYIDFPQIKISDYRSFHSSSMVYGNSCSFLAIGIEYLNICMHMHNLFPLCVRKTGLQTIVFQANALQFI